MNKVLLTFALVLALLACGSFSTRQRHHQRSKRQGALRGRRCRYRGVYYSAEEQFTFQVRRKRFDCTCRAGGRLDCAWTYITPPADAKCLDKVTGARRSFGERWERVQNGMTFDCLCKRDATSMQTYCTDENRCHHDGVSHLTGTTFQTNTISGKPMTCSCMEGKKLSCQHEVEVEATATEAPWVKNYLVRGGKVPQPQITTLQACRTGAKVVTTGDVWNNTRTNAFGQRIVEECSCVNALVKCRILRLLDNNEPHCISKDGRYRTLGQKWLRVRLEIPDQQFECTCVSNENVRCVLALRPRCIDDVSGTIRVAGETWIREHETLSNIRFECTCNSNTKMDCRDIGECDEPSAPDNGVILCAKVGRPGSDRVTYCKPMCLRDYEFVNQNRYYRLWEVCGPMNLHRWSGGFVDDPLAIARCRRPQPGTLPRYAANLYLRTNDCEGLNAWQREELRTMFRRDMDYRSVCRDGCEMTLFKCGRVTA